jgi:hypothetical protein
MLSDGLAPAPIPEIEGDLPERELKKILAGFRGKSPRIFEFWNLIESDSSTGDRGHMA